MTLTGFFRGRRAEIAQRWAELALAVYPEEARKFLSRAADRFANPVGHSLRTGTHELLSQVLEGVRPEAACASLERIVKVRAVQGLAPSEALRFLFELKAVIREEAEAASGEEPSSDELRELERRIDQLVLFAFDIYARRRERVAELRIEELKRRQGLMRRLIERQGPRERLRGRSAKPPVEGGTAARQPKETVECSPQSGGKVK